MKGLAITGYLFIDSNFKLAVEEQVKWGKVRFPENIDIFGEWIGNIFRLFLTVQIQ